MSLSTATPGRGRDPLDGSGAAPGDRISLRHRIVDGATDVIGFLLQAGPEALVVERPDGPVQVPRHSILALRVVPAIPRGRSPEGFSATDLTALAQRTAGVSASPDWRSQRLRLSELIDAVTAESPTQTGMQGVHPVAEHVGPDGRGRGRAWAAGEWGVLQLDGPSDLHPATATLASWLVRRGARNVLLLTPAATGS